MSEIRVVIAEDHHVVRAAVAQFLDVEADIEVVGQVGEGGARLLDIVKEQHPDVLVLDAHMPGPRVIDTAVSLSQEYPDVKILVLSAYNRREYVEGMLKAGAVGYVLKDDSPDTLVRAIRMVAQGEKWLSPQLADILVSSMRQNGPEKPHLTPRETEVLQLMARGLRNEEIAEELVITTQTVKNYVRSIFSKLDVNTRVEAVLFALSEGLVEDDDPDAEP